MLACTHFPLVAAELAAAAPRPLRFIHGADGIARRCAHLLRDARWEGPRAPGRAIFTGGIEGVAPLAPALHGFGLSLLESL